MWAGFVGRKPGTMDPKPSSPVCHRLCGEKSKEGVHKGMAAPTGTAG